MVRSELIHELKTNNCDYLTFIALTSFNVYYTPRFIFTRHYTNAKDREALH